MLRLEAVSIVQGGFRLSADLSIAAGARVAVMGASGAGKSTLLGAIAGFVPVTAGLVSWDGRDLSGVRPGARPLTILFQDQNLFPHLSVADNVGIGLSPSLRLDASQRRRVSEALERVSLAGFGSRRAGTLSGGEAARVALARALIRARPLLLLDEPFGALGPALRAEMLALVAEIAGDTGATVLMVSHDPGDALTLCPDTIVVEGGVAATPAPTEALLAKPPPGLAAYLGK